MREGEEQQARYMCVSRFLRLVVALAFSSCCVTTANSFLHLGAQKVGDKEEGLLGRQTMKFIPQQQEIHSFTNQSLDQDQ
ncbi:hypothetical protein L6452_16035 [Arctium lappa]|uniref:Uncharacterized protein n=1 Tax=Arctium lappa TaxID=4217 RepID=A0ACB9CQ62_ARCLA|nr:hypothetical protein L6452_16035 [Arctium lappa]